MWVIRRVIPVVMSITTPFFTEPAGITGHGSHPITTIPAMLPGAFMPATTRGVAGILV